MNKHLKELIALSKVDKELDSFTPLIEQANKKVSEQKRVIASIEEEMKKVQEQINENRTKIDAFEEKIKTLNQQLKDIESKRKLITTEKELKALTSEEDVAKGNLIYSNEEIDRLNKIISNKEAQLSELKEKLSQEEEKLKTIEEEVNSSLESIEKQKATLYKKREEITHNMDKKILSFYEKIRKWAGNTAVVPVKKQACYGCYLKISDKAYSDVIRSEEIVTCPHCGRILYLEERFEQEEA